MKRALFVAGDGRPGGAVLVNAIIGDKETGGFCGRGDSGESRGTSATSTLSVTWSRLLCGTCDATTRWSLSCTGTLGGTWEQ